MKAFFSKIWSWILSHKIISIVAASGIVVGTTCAIVLPIALHQHSYAAEWSTDATSHWHVASCRHNDERAEFGAHEAASDYEGDETHHWKNCATCGYDMSKEAHNYNKEVASSTYLKSAATETAKAVYYKSCACGMAGTETFETDKTVTEITDVVINGKTYDATAIAAPTFNKNSEGAATIEYKAKDADDAAYTATAPTDAGEYTVRISVAQTSTNTAASATKDFTISPIVIDNLSFEREYSGSKYFYVDINDYALDCHKENLVGIEFECESANVGASVISALVSDDNDDYYAPNYVVGDNVTLTIVPRVLKDVTVTKAYDGTAMIDNYRISWSDKDVYLNAELNSANVADANAVISIQLVGENAGNFSLSADEVTVSITKAQPTISDINVEPKTYDGNPVNEPTFVLDTFVDRSRVAIDYKLSDANDDTYTSTAPTDAGEYTVRIGFIENDNYESYIAYGEFTIEKGAASIESVAMSSDNIVYGSTYELIVNAGAFADAILYQYKLASADDSAYDSIKPTDAGSYVAKAIIPDTDNYTGASATVEFEIEKRVLTDLYKVVIADGNSEFTFPLDDIEAGLSLKVAFEDGSIGAEVVSAEILKDGNPAANYDIDAEECTLLIISNEISVGSRVHITHGMEYSIHLAAGRYLFEVPDMPSGAASIEVRSSMSDDLVLEAPLDKNVVLDIPEAGDGTYIIKIIGSMNDCFVIQDHNEHNAINEYGVCDTCGLYTGADYPHPAGFEDVVFTAEGTKFLRFDIDNNFHYGIQVKADDDISYTVTVYRTDSDGSFHVVELTEDVTNDFISSFDDHFYIVVWASGEGTVSVYLDEQDRP